MAPLNEEKLVVPEDSALPFEQLIELIETTTCTGHFGLEAFLSRFDLSSYAWAEHAIINSYRAVDGWLSWNVVLLDKLFASALGKASDEISNAQGRHAQAHMKLCARLMMARLKNPNLYLANENSDVLHVIGDSHSLCMSDLTLKWKDRPVIIKAWPIRGVKMFHLGSGTPPKYRQFMDWRLRTITKGSEILFSIGEIDSRPNEGIFAQAYKAGMANLKGFESITQATVREFIRFLRDELAEVGHLSKNITLIGLPPIGYDIKKGLPSGASVNQFKLFNARVNEVMREHALAAGWSYIDLQAGASALNAAASQNSRIDDFHMHPEFYRNIGAMVLS